MNAIDEYFLGNAHQLLPAKDTKGYFHGNDYQLLPAKSTKDERNLPDLSLIYKVWGIFWEELKLKYAMLVQQLDKVKEDDVLTFSFLGFKFFGKFKIRSA